MKQQSVFVGRSLCQKFESIVNGVFCLVLVETEKRKQSLRELTQWGLGWSLRFGCCWALLFVASCANNHANRVGSGEAGLPPGAMAVYFDLDGTLLDGSSPPSIRRDSLEAISRFESCGGRVGIASGRNWDQAKLYSELIHADLPLVLMNGAAVVSPADGAILESHSIDLEAVSLVWKMEKWNSHVRGMFVLGGDWSVSVGTDRVFLRHYAETSSLVLREQCDDFAKCEVVNRKPDVIKAMLLVDSGSESEVSGEVSKTLGSKAVVVPGGGTLGVYSVEIFSVEANKFVGIAKASEIVGIPLESVAVFGDGDNDVEMLRGIPLSFAMGNCRPLACQSAMAVIGGNSTDAISKVIERMSRVRCARRGQWLQRGPRWPAGGQPQHQQAPTVW